MTMQRFIRNNRQQIDAIIKAQCSNCRLNDSEREDWIMNDEGLYLWAKSEGVPVDD